MQCKVKCILFPLILIGFAEVTVTSWLWFPRYSVLQVRIIIVSYIVQG